MYGRNLVMRWISIVDPDPQAREALKSLLAHVDAEVRTYATAESFLAGIGGDLPACLITEQRLPAMSGVMLLRQLRTTGRTVPTIFVAASPDIAAAVDAIREGALDFLEKPYVDAHLTQRVLAILSADAARTEVGPA